MQAERDSTIESEVAKLIGQIVPGSGPAVRAEARLADLGLDSLALADLALGLEERFGVRLVDRDFTQLETVGDVVSAAGRIARPNPRIPPGIGRLQQKVKVPGRPVFGWATRLRIRGEEHVPKTGPVILASNHRSFLDIPLLVIACPRPIVLMAKRELYKNRIVSWCLHELGGFPVRREIADLRAVDVGLAVLEQGEVLGVYPEGTRNYGQDMLPFLNGAAWFALETGAPIVPCGIVGTEKVPPGIRMILPRRVRISFGPPIEVERESDPLARRARAGGITTELRGAIAALTA